MDRYRDGPVAAPSCYGLSAVPAYLLHQRCPIVACSLLLVWYPSPTKSTYHPVKYRVMSHAFLSVTVYYSRANSLPYKYYRLPIRQYEQ